MKLSQDAIRRMVGNGNGVVVGGGGGGDIAGYATQAWVNENYLSIEFFSKLFKAYDSAATPNEIKPNDTQSTITNIKAMFGFWTQQYISALGQNSGGGGGGSTTLSGLLDVNIPDPMTQANNGQVLMYNYSQNKWINANLPPTGVTSVGLTMPTGFNVGSSPVTSSGTITVTFANGYALPTTFDVNKGVTAYGWGNHADAGYALVSNVYTKTEADQKFMTIAAFENLFNALDSSSQKVSHPYSSGVASIKAMVGLWTNQYLSALGLNSSGGGGGGGGTVTSVGLTMPTGFNVGSSPVTSSGTITVTFANGYALPTTFDVNKGVTAYGWGDHAQAGYSTPSSVASQMQNYAYISSGVIHIGNNSITPLTQHQTVDGTFWGQSWSNRGTVSGSINAGSNGGQITGFHSIELNNYGTLSGYGGFIDFHFNGSSSDYTSRIIEDASGRLYLDASVGVRIGSALLSWDNDNNALKIQKIDGTSANFYATGGVSALGMSAGASSIDAMTFNYVRANRLYLDTTRYLYVSGGTLYYYNGSESKQIAFIN